MSAGVGDSSAVTSSPLKGSRDAASRSIKIRAAAAATTTRSATTTGDATQAGSSSSSAAASASSSSTAGLTATPASQPITSSLPVSSPLNRPTPKVDTEDATPTTPSQGRTHPLPHGGSNATYPSTPSFADPEREHAFGTPRRISDVGGTPEPPQVTRRVSLPKLESPDSPHVPSALTTLVSPPAQQLAGDGEQVHVPAQYVPTHLGTLVSPATRASTSVQRKASSDGAPVHLAAPLNDGSPQHQSSAHLGQQPSPSATGIPSISSSHVNVAAASPLNLAAHSRALSPIIARPKSRLVAPSTATATTSTNAPPGPNSPTNATANAQQQQQRTFLGPVFKPDGDIDQRYVNQQHVQRKRKVAEYLMVFAALYVVLEVPYICNNHWTIERNYIPIVLRLVLALILYISILINRRLYVARFITHTTDRFDALVCALMIIASAFLCIAEMNRQLTFTFTSVGIEHYPAVDAIMADGLLLGLSLVYAFTAGIARLRWPFLAVHGVVTMSIYLLTTLTQLFSSDPHHSERQILLSLAFQALVVVMFLARSWRAERARAEVVTQQKLQFLERKKAEKLLRSMLPTRILSDYLDGSIGQLQANATIGFMQLHLGALQEEKGPPGSHQPSSPQAIASPGELMQKLHDTFKRIDGIVSMYAIRGVTKIETVATTYLLCAGLLQDIDDHAAAMIDVSLEILAMVTTRLNIGAGAAKRIPVMMRIGISSGPVVGGIIGDKRRYFRVFGDTVNVAARMCTNVKMGCIQISPSCYAALNDRQRAAYVIPPGTKLDIKGKGEMVCYRIESRADWVAKFNKITMNRGQQDRDEPLLNKSFVFHKLVSTEVTKWQLQYHQEPGALSSLQKQVTFVRSARTNSTAGGGGAAAAGKDGSIIAGGSIGNLNKRPASAHAGAGAPGVGGASPLLGAASRLARGVSAATPSSKSSKQPAPSMQRQSSAGAIKTSPVLAPRRPSAARIASASLSRTHTKHRSADGSRVPQSQLGGGAGGHQQQPSVGNAHALTRSLSPLNGKPRGSGDESLTPSSPSSSSSSSADSSTTSPFCAAQIERFFQVHYGREFVQKEMRTITALLAAFEVGVLIYLGVYHPAPDDGPFDWDTSSAKNISPIIMMGVLLTMFLLYDFLSVLQHCTRMLCPQTDEDDESDGNSTPDDSGDHSNSPPVGGMNQSPSPTTAAVAAAGTGKSQPRAGTAATVDDHVPHFIRHLQTYTALFCLLCHVWVLIGLQLWRVAEDSQVNPVFAMLLLTFYSGFALRLQFRLLVPLSIATWVVFGILLIVDRFYFAHILLIQSNLLVGGLISLSVLYGFELHHRHNFLLAYALEKEQEYMDQFLNNLLPKDVVLVLKKQNPGTNRVGGGMGAMGAGRTGFMTTATGKVIGTGAGVMTTTGKVIGGAAGFLKGAHHAQQGSREGLVGSRNSTMMTTLKNSPAGRPSNSGGNGRAPIGSASPATNGGNTGNSTPKVTMSIGEGGVASRFAMHFPRTTVFESDIVGYTQMVSALSPSETLNLLNLIFSRFDTVCHETGVEKIETIGDAFMCMVFDGAPDPVLDFALQIVGVLRSCSLETYPHQDLQIRMGICTGSCFGGIVGTEIPRFHLFGQAHDVAIHIEQNGRPGDIIVSSSTAALSSSRYTYEPLALVVDEMATFLLKEKKPYDEDDLNYQEDPAAEPYDEAAGKPESHDDSGACKQAQALSPTPDHFVSILPEGGPSAVHSIATSSNRVHPGPISSTKTSSTTASSLELAMLNLQHAHSTSSTTAMKHSSASTTATTSLPDSVVGRSSVGSMQGGGNGTPVGGSHRNTGSNGSYVLTALNPNHSIHTSASAVASSTPLMTEAPVIQQDQFITPELA